MKHHLTTGNTGEQLAVAYLKRHHFRILETNWRYRRAEIDIIGKKNGLIIFFEVKTRSNTFYGPPELFVSRRKKQLMADASIFYLQQVGHTGDFRFDIISIVIKNANEYKLRHIVDAFFPGLNGFV